MEFSTKTHKPGNNVRLTFSSKGSCTQNLSSVLDHVYLKPTVTSDLCKRRLEDTRDALMFIESINNHLLDKNIEDKPYIYALDVTNFFPSVDFMLSMPAMKRYLTLKGFAPAEVNAVCKGLKVVRIGNFFRWKNEFFNQISGRALGDPDSCSYSDLSLVDDMVPRSETALNIQMDPFFKVYRDDGLGFSFSQPQIILNILEFFNGFNEKIQWTVPYCTCCNVPEVVCPNYSCLNFLDISITWKQKQKGNKLIWQFQTTNYSKPTDVHAYLHPKSCSSPHLSVKGIAVSKTVGTRLRTIHSNDQELLLDLILFAGYLISRGYQEHSVKTHLADMANRSRSMLLSGQYKNQDSFVMPLVTKLHPAITMLTPLVKKAFEEAATVDPALQFILPSSSVMVAYTRLPNLQLLLCRNDQNSLVAPQQRSDIRGHIDTGCRCQLCKVSTFGPCVVSKAMPGYRIRIPKNLTCKSGPGVVYYAVCESGKKHCDKAHYVGRAWATNSEKFPMRLRWSNHKHHAKIAYNKCKLTEHLSMFHKGEDPQLFVKIILLDQASSLDETLKLELMWTRKIFAFFPTGLNERTEDSIIEVPD